jgi:hypothetical protein
MQAVRPRFAPKDLPPLQAADLSAWEQRNFVRMKLSGTLDPDYDKLRPSLRRLVERPNDYGVMDRDQIAFWASAQVGVPKRSEPWDEKTWRPFLLFETDRTRVRSAVPQC